MEMRPGEHDVEPVAGVALAEQHPALVEALDARRGEQAVQLLGRQVAEQVVSGQELAPIADRESQVSHGPRCAWKWGRS